MRYKSEEMKEKIISAIESFFLAHRRSPTITELVGLAGLSRSRVHAYLKGLDLEGRIHYDGKHLDTPVTRKADPAVALSPILGAVACGQPQYAEENFESYVPLPTVIFGDAAHFILRAQGDSMVEAGIEDGGGFEDMNDWYDEESVDYAGVAERFKAPDLKSGDGASHRGFESYHRRQPSV